MIEKVDQDSILSKTFYLDIVNLNRRLNFEVLS